VELKLDRSGETITIHPQVFRVSGDRVAICRLTRPEAPGPGTAGSGSLARSMEALYAAATEAILFTDRRGTIRTANDRFLAMVDAAHMSDVKGRNFAEFLVRGQVDFGVLSENAERAGHVRLYATEFVSDYGTRMAVEVSATILSDAGDAALAFVARDAGRVDAVRLPAAQVDSPAQQNIVELVGSASLKEIVAETNDVIEKLCIETAIRLTNNNRVAAAEMLGLSRQSLYVKLRKYDLVKRSEED
jgi:transcriptional regulator PpsR